MPFHSNISIYINQLVESPSACLAVCRLLTADLSAVTTRLVQLRVRPQDSF